MRVEQDGEGFFYCVLFFLTRAPYDPELANVNSCPLSARKNTSTIPVNRASSKENCSLCISWPFFENRGSSTFEGKRRRLDAIHNFLSLPKTAF